MNTKKDNIETLFDRLKNEFDIEEPTADHNARFLAKLNDRNHAKKRNWWRPLSIAASIALLICVGIGVSYNNSVSNTESFPEVENAQFYFASLLQQEIEKVNALKSPETQKIIEDAMNQISNLEQDYKQLENELIQNGNSRQILNAMITNFQTRIDLLQDVLTQIDEINNFKNNENETTII